MACERGVRGCGMVQRWLFATDTYACLLGGHGFSGKPPGVKRRAWDMVLECLDREWLFALRP